MFQKLFCFLFLVFLISEIDGHKYHLGSCPAIEPIPDFNIDGMLGIWYVIQKTSTSSSCMTYNFTKLEEPHHYNLEEVRQRSILGLWEHEHHSNGELFAPDLSVPGKMKVKFASNVIGKASFTVFMTDYNNYAGIFTCQGLGVGHRESASILSRTPTLDQVHIDKLRTRLASCNIDPFELCIVPQEGCPRNENGSEGVYINGDDLIVSTVEEVAKLPVGGGVNINVDREIVSTVEEVTELPVGGGVNINVDREIVSTVEEVTELPVGGGVNINVDYEIVSTAEEVTEPPNRINAEGDQSSITPEVLQNENTERSSNVDFDVRSRQTLDTEWLP